MKHSLDKAIKDHEKHMVDPKTATQKGQTNLMVALKTHKKEMTKAGKKK